MITSTRVKWEDIAHLIEGGWEIDIYSDKLGEAVMSKIGNHELDGEGKPVDLTGKYVTVWKKDADGKWKIYRDIFNDDSPTQ